MLLIPYLTCRVIDFPGPKWPMSHSNNAQFQLLIINGPSENVMGPWQNLISPRLLNKLISTLEH